MKKSKPAKGSPGILETAAVAIGSTLGTLVKNVSLAAETAKKAAKRTPVKAARKKTAAKTRKKAVAAKKKPAKGKR